MKTPVLESFLIQLQILRTATLLKRDSCTPVKFLRTPYFTGLTEHLQWLLLKVSGFKPATLLKKEFRQRCFSLNFAKFLRTFFDRTLPNDWFLSLSVNFEKFFRTSLLQSTSEKLLISSTSCSISTSRYIEKLLLFTGAIQAFYTRTRRSHSKAFIHLKSMTIICEEVNL